MRTAENHNPLRESLTRCGRLNKTKEPPVRWPICNHQDITTLHLLPRRLFLFIPGFLSFPKGEFTLFISLLSLFLPRQKSLFSTSQPIQKAGIFDAPNPSKRAPRALPVGVSSTGCSSEAVEGEDLGRSGCGRLSSERGHHGACFC